MKSTIWNRYKTKWNITSKKQVVIILSVFTLTGFSTLKAHHWIDQVLNITKDTNLLIKFFVIIFLVMPIWITILYLYSVLLGQKEFFYYFLKNKIKLIIKLKNTF